VIFRVPVSRPQLRSRVYASEINRIPLADFSKRSSRKGAIGNVIDAEQRPGRAGGDRRGHPSSPLNPVVTTTFPETASITGRPSGVAVDVHGRGLLWSVEFADPSTGEPFVDPWSEPDADNPVGKVRDHAQDRGVLFGSGRPDTQVLVSPPLCIDEADVNEAIEALDRAVAAVFE